MRNVMRFFGNITINDWSSFWYFVVVILNGLVLYTDYPVNAVITTIYFLTVLPLLSNRIQDWLAGE